MRDPACLAHELRTPLTILKGRLHALQDGVADPATEDWGRMLGQIDALLRIVERLGTSARAGATDEQSALTADIRKPDNDAGA